MGTDPSTSVINRYLQSWDASNLFVMGGAAAEVGEDTTEIVLEAAYFDPMTISRTSKRLGLRSESSARFERGIDPNAVLAGSDRAVELLVEHAAARVLTDVIDAYPAAIAAPRVTVRTARVNHVLGTSISTEQVTALLAPLGITCEADGADAITAVVPTYRPDIEREIDLIEEVARRLGLDAIPRTLPSNPDHVGGLTAGQAQRRLVADALVGTGCSEAYTLSLLAEPLVAPFGYALGDTVTLTNPLRAEESVLRPAILPGLLGAVALVAESWPDQSRPIIAGLMGAAINSGILLLSQLARYWSITPESWRWIFQFAGVPALLGVFVLMCFTDRPRHAKWLTQAERDHLENALAIEALTAVLLQLNVRYKTRVAPRFTGID